jgi:hypothetical protein
VQTTTAPQNWDDPYGYRQPWESFAMRCFGTTTTSKLITRFRPMTQPLNAAQALLIDRGLDLANQLHLFLVESLQGRTKEGTYLNNPCEKWTHKFLFLALLGYAASMAKFSELDRGDFIALAEGFYDNVEVNPKSDPPTA